jgi:hypothetical protein
MKKLIFLSIFSFAAFIPLIASADLECGSSFDNYAAFHSTQTSKACFAPDPQNPNPVLHDTISGAYTVSSGQTISKPTGTYNCLERSNTSVVTTVYSAADCNGDLYDKDGHPITILGTPAPQTTSPTTPYTTPTTNSNAFCNGQTCTYVPLEPLPIAPQGGYGSLPGYLQAIFTLLISLGGLFAVTMLTLSGISYMLSESVTNKGKARDRIIAALWGLFLLAASWLILNTINPNLLTFNLNPQAISNAFSQTGAQGNGNIVPNPCGNSDCQTALTSCQQRGGTYHYSTTYNQYLCETP